MAERDEDEVRAGVDGMESEAEEMSSRSDELGDEVEDVRDDWQAKRRDSSVPGAEPPAEEEESEGGEVAGDWEGEGPAADEAGQ
jgi:hypothetical protein